jgi:hypothetical protein
MDNKRTESGQSILVIAFIVMILLALVAVVVDVGNAYAHRRIVQNAVDAAAMAGVRQLAFRGTGDPPMTVLHIQVSNVINDFAEDNGLNRDDVRAWFVNDEGTRVDAVHQSLSPVPQNAVGVEVEGDLPFETYFAHLLGFPTMTVTADSNGYVQTGPCSGNCLFPVVLAGSTFADEPGGKPVVGKVYKLWDDGQLAPGNFGWAYWVDGDGQLRGTPPQGPQVTVLSPNILDTCRSGAWEVGDWVHGDCGVNFQPVLDELNQRIQNSLPVTVTIPIYDEVTEQGNNTVFHIAGFAAFRLVCAHSSRAHYAGDCGPDANQDNEKYLTGEFVRMVTTGFEDGCFDGGISGVSFRPPKSEWMPRWPSHTPTPMPSEGGAHVGSLNGQSEWQNANKWSADVIIVVHDQDHQNLPNATVNGTWSGGLSGSVSCTTNAGGACTISTGLIDASAPDVTFTVNNISHATLDYDPGENHANGITVNKP